MNDYLDHQADERERNERDYIKHMLDMERRSRRLVFSGPAKFFPQAYVDYDYPMELDDGADVILDVFEVDGVTWVHTPSGVYEQGDVHFGTHVYYPVMRVAWFMIMELNDGIIKRHVHQ